MAASSAKGASTQPTAIYSVSRRWIGRALGLFFRLTGMFSDVFFGLVYRNRTDKMPPIKNMVLLESAVSLARMIRAGKLTSQEVVQSFMARIEEVNPILNCVTENRFEAAMEEARAVDELIASGTKTSDQLERETPFLGVPFTCKDSIAVGGLHQTLGMWSRRNCIAERDADVIQLMREAGAIPLAITNVPEVCMWWETTNKIYGRARNPYVTSRITGGSSGGEGALIAAAGSPFGIGSDIGGSIRMPCFFNGIFGHKPTADIVSNVGQLPVAVGQLNSYLVTGPMCRHAGDLLPMYQVLAGPNFSRLSLGSRPAPAQLRYFMMEDDGGFPITSPVHPDIRQAMRRVARLLEDAQGVRVQSLQLHSMFHQLEIWTHKMHQERDAPSFAEELCDRKGAIRPGWELLKWCLQLSNHTLPALFVAITESLTSQNPEESAYFVRLCEKLKHQLNETLGSDGVLLYPPHPTPAPYHIQPIFKPFNFAYTSIFNVLEVPVTQVPLGLGSWGVPVGVQVVAAHGRDHLSLAVAEELERLAGGWVSPSVIE